MCECALPEFFDTKRLKSRKDHKCDECGFTIKEGTFYFKSVGKWDGKFLQYKRCLFCDAADDCLDGLDQEECICFGDLWNFYHEMAQCVGMTEMPFLLLKEI